jgi:hypothetical protein
MFAMYLMSGKISDSYVWVYSVLRGLLIDILAKRTTSKCMQPKPWWPLQLCNIRSCSAFHFDAPDIVVERTQ